jgi:hypothetical protein
MAREFSPDSPAALAAAALFLRDVIEIWILFGLGIIITVLRTYARVSAVGFKELQLDDYLAWLGIVSSQSCGLVHRRKESMLIDAGTKASLCCALSCRILSRCLRERLFKSWYDSGSARSSLAK